MTIPSASNSNYSSPDRFWRNNQNYLGPQRLNGNDGCSTANQQQGYGTAITIDAREELQRNLKMPLFALTTTVFSVASLFFAFKNESNHNLMIGGFISSGCFASMSAATCLYSACKN